MQSSFSMNLLLFAFTRLHSFCSFLCRLLILDSLVRPSIFCSFSYSSPSIMCLCYPWIQMRVYVVLDSRRPKLPSSWLFMEGLTLQSSFFVRTNSILGFSAALHSRVSLDFLTVKMMNFVSFRLLLSDHSPFFVFQMDSSQRFSSTMIPLLKEEEGIVGFLCPEPERSYNLYLLGDKMSECSTHRFMLMFNM